MMVIFFFNLRSDFLFFFFLVSTDLNRYFSCAHAPPSIVGRVRTWDIWTRNMPTTLLGHPWGDMKWFFSIKYNGSYANRLFSFFTFLLNILQLRNFTEGSSFLTLADMLITGLSLKLDNLKIEINREKLGIVWEGCDRSNFYTT